MRPDVPPGSIVVWIDANGFIRTGWFAVRTYTDAEGTRRVEVSNSAGHFCSPAIERVGTEYYSHTAG